ncbi:hypothetical protein COO60DRAFT_1549145 [Scenedesmus sp. NREL 46B-D3]|nr:hypothetical protein COO60DRAFT_1549145 [Scenedesmus sp. NREL 46B-D3]
MRAWGAAACSARPCCCLMTLLKSGSLSLSMLAHAATYTYQPSASSLLLKPSRTTLRRRRSRSRKGLPQPRDTSNTYSLTSLPSRLLMLRARLSPSGFTKCVSRLMRRSAGVTVQRLSSSRVCSESPVSPTLGLTTSLNSGLPVVGSLWVRTSCTVCSFTRPPHFLVCTSFSSTRNAEVSASR